MKNAINKFTIKSGVSPECIGSPLHINVGYSCILVFDENTCVGVVWEHTDSKGSEAIGQAEIRFFEGYKDAYGLWHRMFVNEQRLSYERLVHELEKANEYIYWGKIRGK